MRVKIVYDKVNKRKVNIRWFIDEQGDYWIDADPKGVQMSGNIPIMLLKKSHPQYEIREI